MKKFKWILFLATFILQLCLVSCEKDGGGDNSANSKLVGHWAEAALIDQIPNAEQNNYVFKSDNTGDYYRKDCNNNSQYRSLKFTYEYDNVNNKLELVFSKSLNENLNEGFLEEYTISNLDENELRLIIISEVDYGSIVRLYKQD